MKSQRGQTGLVGEYAVLSALILNGFNAARMDGNSRDIDILCSSSDFDTATKIQVKTEGPQAFYRSGKPFYSFHITTLDRYRDSYRQAIIDQRIYFVFYLCPQTKTALEVKPFDENRTYGRFFVASPEEVVGQLDLQLKHNQPKQLYFRLFAEANDYCTKQNGGLIEDYENRWDKLTNSTSQYYAKDL